MSIFQEFKERGLIHDATHEEDLAKVLDKESISFYCGFDPTADSLHVGSLLPLITMRRLQKAGHRPIALIGSATGMIGDPSGKSEERKLLDEEQIKSNINGIKEQIDRLNTPGNGEHSFKFVSNIDWLGKISLIEFLRDTGKLFSVNAMMAKDSVKSRLQDRDQGISYTEFSYMILQAYDYLHLYIEHDCRLQIGGSDQWGNITAGIDLIRRQTDLLTGQAFGLTFPLLTTASGSKFGKTEGGNVWLDAKRTSPYEFYQFWINTADEDVIKYLKMFSEKSLEEIGRLEIDLKAAPERREAQNALAAEMCDLVHGEEATRAAINSASVLFGFPIEDQDDETLKDIFSDVPSSSLSLATLKDGIAITDLLTHCKLAKSKGEARRLVDGGGVYINNKKIADQSFVATSAHLASESMMVLRVGKKKYHLVKVS